MVIFALLLAFIAWWSLVMFMVKACSFSPGSKPFASNNRQGTLLGPSERSRLVHPPVSRARATTLFLHGRRKVGPSYQHAISHPRYPVSNQRGGSHLLQFGGSRKKPYCPGRLRQNKSRAQRRPLLFRLTTVCERFWRHLRHLNLGQRVLQTFPLSFSLKA